MPLLVARSLLVYGGVAALAIFLARRFVGDVPWRIGLVIAAAPLLFTGKAMWTGGVWAPLDIQYHFEPFRSHRAETGMTAVQNPILSDVVFSMIPWQKAVREAVKSGHAPLWNRFVLSGEPLLAVQQAAALHPFTWIGFLLPLPMSWTFQMSARLLLAILSAYLFARDLRCRPAASLFGALGWGFSDFMIFWSGYPVGDALAPFPLLLLGLTRLARDADRKAVALTVVALCLIVLAGHPESLLFAVAAAGLYFLFLLGFARRGRRARPFLLSLAAGALALGLTAVQLAPLAEALPRTWEHTLRSQWYAHTRKSSDPAESLGRAQEILVPFVHGQSGHGQVRAGFGVPGSYAGALLLPFAVSGLFSGRRRRWALLALAAAGFTLWVRLAIVTDAVAALPLFDLTVLDYFVFLAAFATCGLAALGAERFLAGEGRRPMLLATTLGAAAIAALSIFQIPAVRALQMSASYLGRRTLLELVPLSCVLILVALPCARRRPGPAFAACLAIFVAARVLEAGDVVPTCPARAFFPRLPILEGIPRGTPARIVGVGEIFVPNASALYELEDARGYDSMTLESFVQTFPLWCVPQGAWFNRVDDLGKPFLSFLNVRYALAPAGQAVPEGWRWRGRDGGVDRLENMRALDRVFVPASIAREPDAARRLDLLKNISDFRKRGVVAETGTGPPGEWTPNGAATVRITSYRGDALSIDVEAGAPAVVATSIPAWPGWNARLDGARLDALSYNHAFLGFRVPGGSHRLELRYRPDGFVVGACLSLLTLAAIAAYFIAVRGRRGGSGVLSSPAPR